MISQKVLLPLESHDALRLQTPMEEEKFGLALLVQISGLVLPGNLPMTFHQQCSTRRDVMVG